MRVRTGRKTGAILVDTGRCGSKLDEVGLIIIRSHAGLTPHQGGSVLATVDVKKVFPSHPLSVTIL